MLREDLPWLLPAVLMALLQVKWIWGKLPDFEDRDTLIEGEYRDLDIFKLDYLMCLAYSVLLIQLAFPLFSITNSQNTISFFRISGYFLVGLGFVISWLALKKLGDNWTGMDRYRIKRKQTLVTVGVYSLVRHPIYLAVLLELAGFELVANSYLVFLFLIGGLKFFLNHIVKEERLLEKHFGSSFKNYKKKTKLLIPFLW